MHARTRSVASDSWLKEISASSHMGPLVEQRRMRFVGGMPWSGSADEDEAADDVVTRYSPSDTMPARRHSFHRLQSLDNRYCSFILVRCISTHVDKQGVDLACRRVWIYSEPE